MDEQVEVTIVIGEDKVKAMLDELSKAKKSGDHSVLVEHGAITFQVYALDSEKLREFNAAHPV